MDSKVLVAQRISKQAAVYNNHPFIRGIATILVVAPLSKFEEILAEVRVCGGRLSPNADYIQQGNVITRWIPPDCPRHMLFGLSAILVMKDRTLKLDAQTSEELENTLLRARMASMPNARIELF